MTTIRFGFRLVLALAVLAAGGPAAMARPSVSRAGGGRPMPQARPMPQQARPMPQTRPMPPMQTRPSLPAAGVRPRPTPTAPTRPGQGLGVPRPQPSPGGLTRPSPVLAGSGRPMTRPTPSTRPPMTTRPNIPTGGFPGGMQRPPQRPGGPGPNPGLAGGATNGLPGFNTRPSPGEPARPGWIDQAKLSATPTRW
jgi:hypothetical protein